MPIISDVNSSLIPELEQQLLALRTVLTEQLPDQMRRGTVDPSEWRNAHEADKWLAENRLTHPAVVVAAFENLLHWFVLSSNEFLDWMRRQIAVGQQGNPNVEKELRTRIETLWRRYDEEARKVLRAAYEARADIPSPPRLHETRILFLASNPTTTLALDLEEELRSVEMELRGVRFREEIRLVPCHAVRPDDLIRHLRQQQPSVVHFSGHGTSSGIVLRSESDQAIVSGGALERLFNNRGVKLVVLNACFSHEQAESIVKVVPTVVGTTEAVDDEAARRFSTAFYRTLGDGHRIGDAFRDGVDAVAVYALGDVFKSFGRLDRSLVGPEAA